MSLDNILKTDNHTRKGFIDANETVNDIFHTYDSVQDNLQLGICSAICFATTLIQNLKIRGHPPLELA